MESKRGNHAVKHLNGGNQTCSTVYCTEANRQYLPVILGST